MTNHLQEQQKEQVQLLLSLSTCPPHTVAINNASPAEPLRLIASIEQIGSPLPDRAVTILTKYSCLDTTPSEDAFFLNAMSSPRVVAPDTQRAAPDLPLRPVRRHITTTRVSGDPDLLKRGQDSRFYFITIPPVAKSHTEVIFELPPSRLTDHLGDKNESLQDKLTRFLRPGDTYEIEARDLGIRWWAFGSLQDEDGLKGKKISRWTLPDDLSLVREPGEDETEEAVSRLRDLVDLHDVNYLSSRSAVDGERMPDIKQMRSSGWVFGEPESRLVMIPEHERTEATFTIAK
ncbi:hypothetical protein F5Y16DRAFT_393954 [Xylariaceae sp. FL0255]|nr:hypothetical protein F5Y16DRAFT_393954 [Xylariaceae sp. FL0255]